MLRVYVYGCGHESRARENSPKETAQHELSLRSARGRVGSLQWTRGSVEEGILPQRHSTINVILLQAVSCVIRGVIPLFPGEGAYLALHQEEVVTGTDITIEIIVETTD